VLLPADAMQSWARLSLDLIQSQAKAKIAGRLMIQRLTLANQLKEVGLPLLAGVMQ
jgi:hypothetical protein